MGCGECEGVEGGVGEGRVLGVVGYGMRRTVRDPVIVHEYRAAVLPPPLTVALILEGKGYTGGSEDASER